MHSYTGGVMGNDAPERVEVFRDLAGERHVRLSANVEEDWRDAPQDSGEEPQMFYMWDEVVFPTSMTKGEIEESFDSIWYARTRLQMDEDEWRTDVDSALLDLMEMAVS